MKAANNDRVDHNHFNLEILQSEQLRSIFKTKTGSLILSHGNGPIVKDGNRANKKLYV